MATGPIVLGLDHMKFLASLEILPLDTPKMPAGVYGDGSDHKRYRRVVTEKNAQEKV